MWEYTDTVREHFEHPRNAGALKDANAIGEVGSIACGDALKLYLKINDKGVIEDASFQTFGCASAIASSSALTEMLKGKTVEEAQKITNKDIVAYLGGLPQAKMHCSVMGEEALDAALRNWRGEPAVPHTHEGTIVCKCFAVTDTQIRTAIRENGLKTVEDVTNFTKAGGGCTECHDTIQGILDEELGNKPAPKPAPRPLMTNVQRMQKIMYILDAQIRPLLQADGGDIELVDVNGHKVTVAMKGHCSGCSSCQTISLDMIERVLCQNVEEGIKVVEAQA
ncbi:MAG: Fe-S cluster assembly protein NifU [Desulfovibrionaceae bacterium]|nr:Fe-S cluster assembly protein NifU [Desulfovibrionaceae bacterium]